MKSYSNQKYRRIIYSILFIYAFFGIGTGLYSHCKKNIHTILPHVAYRSAELNHNDLSTIIQKQHIQSVINLRGANPSASWYQEEIASTLHLHVQHIDIGLSSKKLPTPMALQQLVQTLQTTPRPLLIHCLSGVDRSGLAGAIVLILDNHSLEDAEKQFSWRYYALSPKTIGKQVFTLYHQWLAETGQTHSKEHFIEWTKSYKVKK